MPNGALLTRKNLFGFANEVDRHFMYRCFAFWNSTYLCLKTFAQKYFSNAFNVKVYCFMYFCNACGFQNRKNRTN